MSVIKNLNKIATLSLFLGIQLNKNYNYIPV